MHKPQLSVSLALLFGLFIFTPQVSRADQVSDFSFDTSALVGRGAFFINFQLTNGDPASNNTASLTAFDFGGGVVGHPATVETRGGVSGNLNSGVVTLQDTAFVNDFVQAFTPGEVLGFRLNLSPPAFGGGTPDEFTFAILNINFEEVLTTDPLGTNVLLRVDITSANPDVERFAVQPIPEPATLLLLSTGLAALITSVRHRHHAQKNDSSAG